MVLPCITFIGVIDKARFRLSIQQVEDLVSIGYLVIMAVFYFVENGPITTRNLAKITTRNLAKINNHKKTC